MIVADIVERFLRKGAIALLSTNLTAPDRI